MKVIMPEPGFGMNHWGNYFFQSNLYLGLL